eukprot:CAMPEP_0118859650 /NCGR_PEP_ID=MMETSP1163-20130328/5808_1 /TAXON_ID=124430 /ORGANISM="Phaeomonas parva, Strain CCMP2877" /LENGTH=373 /DNA_ID=CAMNT_0006793271 /DNA_START=109 /DNA_END=1230 /DNA_ORIENTATION=-
MSRGVLSWCLGLALILGSQAFSPPAARARRAQLRMSATAPAAAKPRPIGAPADSTVVVAGATGYIGKFVVKDLAKRGYKTVALVRDASRVDAKEFPGVDIREVDVCDPAALEKSLKEIPGGVQGAVSCLASRSGSKDDSYKIDYQATLNVIDAVRGAGASHFVLLSAFCVRKPLLQFQNAKLKLEAALTAPERADILHAIVRPTAFFKSLSGQLEVVEAGAPFVMFEKDDGSMMKCNPIAEADLAEYMVNCFEDVSLQNRILDLGGPDDPLSMKEQGELLFKAVGKEPKFITVPSKLFDVIIGGLDFLAKFFPGMADTAEFGRIGKYYAVEDMVAVGEGEKYGKVTLAEHYKRIAEEGQEYDPYTTVFGAANK